MSLKARLQRLERTNTDDLPVILLFNEPDVGPDPAPESLPRNGETLDAYRARCVAGAKACHRRGPVLVSVWPGAGDGALFKE